VLLRKTVSGIMLTLLLTSMLTLAFNIQPVGGWTGTVYIRADGSIDPPDAPITTYDNITYTLTDNIVSDADGIVVERDNIVVDGAGYTIQGTREYPYSGVDLTGRSNVTIKNMEINTFFYGIRLDYSSNNTIVGNNITANNLGGIGLFDYSSNNTIVGNNIANNYDGIRLFDYSSNNTIVGNNIANNSWGFYLDSSSNNTIVGNNITANNGYGISFQYSSNNTIVGNNIANNSWGIWLSSSSNNGIVGNNITANNLGGIGLSDYSSNNNGIVGNNIANNGYGIFFDYSSNNTIVGNNIANNSWGIWLHYSSNNYFYHNNFISNAKQVDFDSSSLNFWDDGYPCGGNYWSNYNGTDLYSGPYQNEAGSDGISDVPYNVSDYYDAVDKYPLMGPFNALDVGVWDNVAYTVDVISNSTVGDLIFDPLEGPFISFNVTGADGTKGFCRITIPKKLLWAEEGEWVILVGGEEVNYTSTLDKSNTYLYFTYNHSTKTIQIQGTQTLPIFYLNITSTEGGTTDPTPDNYTYVNSTIVSITAIPDANYVFSHWELDGSNIGSDNPVDILMDANHSLLAVFVLRNYTLTITSTLGGTTDPPTGTYNYTAGSSLNVTAIPNAGYSFDHWLLDGEIRTENPISILMDLNHTLEAFFIDDIKPDISVPWQDPPPDNVQSFQNVTVWVNVTDYGTGVKNVTLWYSLDNGTTWEPPINMTALPIPSDTTITYEATIPGYENCAWITYKIVAYDKAGNNATRDNNGYFYKYHVIPEFPTTIMLTLLMLTTLIATILLKKRRKTKHQPPF